MKKTRTNIQFNDKEMDWLKEKAREESKRGGSFVSVASIVRRAVRFLMESMKG